MKKPTNQKIAEYAIKYIVESKLAVDNGSADSAEIYMAKAVMILNQIANIDTLNNPRLDSVLHEFHELIIG